MCEVLLGYAATPQPIEALLEAALVMEREGSARQGYGIAWLDGDRLCLHREPRTLLGADLPQEVRAATTRAILIHLREPSNPLSVQVENTQPYLRGPYAFCHNGYLERHEEFRGRYVDRLEGISDSEVGLCRLEEIWQYGQEPSGGLRQMAGELKGDANLFVLEQTGVGSAYAGNTSNDLVRCSFAGFDLVATTIHKRDDSVFEVALRGASDIQHIPFGQHVRLGGSV